jgi:hypothetical protein
MTDPEVEARKQQRSLLRDYITEPEAAAQLGVDKRTLRKWRRANQGPPGYQRIGVKYFYRIQAIEQWLRSREAKPSRSRAS